MTPSANNQRPRRSRLGGVLILAGVLLLGWVGFKTLGREMAQREARSELRDSWSQATLAVSKAPAWSPDAVVGSDLELPSEPPAFEDSAQLAKNQKKSRLIGRIFAPRIGMDTMAFEGIDLPTLDLGAGHFPGTPLPGRRGNVSFAGHRNTDFRELRDVRLGDSIYVESNGSTHVYEVSKTHVVEPSRVDVVSSRGRDELTLVTCHPFDWVGPAPRRFIVHADFVRTAPTGAPGSSP